MDGNNLASWLAKMLLLGLLQDERDKIVSSLVGRNLVAGDTTTDVELSDDR